MRIIINKEVVEFKNKKENITKIFEFINKYITERKLRISCLIVDGKEVCDNMNEYLTTNIGTIQEVVVIIMTSELVVDETLISAYDYIASAVLMIKPLAEAFYQSPKQESWKDMANLFEGIQWIMDTTVRIDGFDNLKKIINDYLVWNEYVQKNNELKGAILDLEDAMVNQDHVLIGDLLQYEILPIFVSLEEKLRFLIPSGRNDHVS